MKESYISITLSLSGIVAEELASHQLSLLLRAIIGWLFVVIVKAEDVPLQNSIIPSDGASGRVKELVFKEEGKPTFPIISPVPLMRKSAPPSNDLFFNNMNPP